MLNEELVHKLAHGDQETHDKISKLPISMRMAYGLAVDEMRRAENIIPISNGMSVYVKPNKAEEDENGLGEAYKRMLDQRKAKEAEAIRQRNEQIEKRAKQQAERARAGLWG